MDLQGRLGAQVLSLGRAFDDCLGLLLALPLEASVILFVPWFPVNKEQEAALRAAGHHLPGGSSIQGPWNPAEKVQMLSSVWRMLGRNGV